MPYGHRGIPGLWSYPVIEPFSPVRSSRRHANSANSIFGQSLLQSFGSDVKSQEEIEADFLEAAIGADKSKLPWLEDSIVEQRRKTLGLKSPDVCAFIDECEFIGLGCFCGASRALQCLGLKRHSYPFDWVRTSVPCTVHCFKNKFRNFCTSSFTGEELTPGVQLHGGADWGGSFWHHDPDKPKVQSDFKRRIARLRGSSEVPPDKARVFALSLNSLSDLSQIPLLLSLLQEMLPEAYIYMVIFIDSQPTCGPILVDGADNLVFYTLHHEMFDDNGKNWSEQRQAEAYAGGIAVALRYWAGIYLDDLPVVDSFAALFARCWNFEGGYPAEKLFWPVRVPNEECPELSHSLLNTISCDSVCNLPWPLSILGCNNFDDDSELDLIVQQKAQAVYAEAIVSEPSKTLMPKFPAS